MYSAMYSERLLDVWLKPSVMSAVDAAAELLPMTTETFLKSSYSVSQNSSTPPMTVHHTGGQSRHMPKI